MTQNNMNDTTQDASKMQGTNQSTQQRQYTSQEFIKHQLNLHKDKITESMLQFQELVNKNIDTFFKDNYDKKFTDIGVDGLNVLGIALIPGMGIFAGITGIVDSLQDIKAIIQVKQSYSSMQKKLDDKFAELYQRINNSDWFL